MTIFETVPWSVGTVMLPLASALAMLLVPSRVAPRLGLITASLVGICVAGLAAQVALGGPVRYQIGGWGAPLGIDWHADGLAVVMLATTAVVGGAVTVYAQGYFALRLRPGRGSTAVHERAYFWPLWLFLWTALNALFLAADAFNVYVTLEVATLAAVSLVALAGTSAALVAALRYLLVSLLGSLAYLLGVGVLYHRFGTLDFGLLAEAVTSGPAAWVAACLMTAGMLLKTGIFPLHFWLPQAHASAPAPVSAVLSALVVKGSLLILLRLWGTVFDAIRSPAIDVLLGLLGAGAVLWGSLLALEQRRLKLMIGYSTVAQLGYLLLLFPLAGSAAWDGVVWKAAIVFAISHACAKAAAFLAAGTVLRAAGHDRIADLRGVGVRLPMTLLAFGLAGVNLIGLPPTAGFLAKWLLITAAFETGQWWWAVVILVGGLLAAISIFRVVGLSLSGTPVAGAIPEPTPFERVARRLHWAAIGLALCPFVLGLAAMPVMDLLEQGGAADAALTDWPSVSRDAGETAR